MRVFVRPLPPGIEQLWCPKLGHQYWVCYRPPVCPKLGHTGAFSRAKSIGKVPGLLVPPSLHTEFVARAVEWRVARRMFQSPGISGRFRATRAEGRGFSRSLVAISYPISDLIWEKPLACGSPAASDLLPLDTGYPHIRAHGSLFRALPSQTTSTIDTVRAQYPVVSRCKGRLVEAILRKASASRYWRPSSTVA
ncbi:hypothetical protein X942_6064 [Burkholderia pseudomallei MSHR5596]|uniref:Uncharacterized protein n=1 Tax=Burkholderia pseudomallei TaxID=28450 RepID=A0AA40MF61_BURPE|nr:hypothetical protein X942_6064 [Burkholderia pseudomallei MSHR5596]KGX17234.1 hypothetical protein Y036_6039 [Burkholderia pseudomallei]